MIVNLTNSCYLFTRFFDPCHHYRPELSVKAGIIAAGDGSRLRSEGIASLKPLVPVAGTPLIERLIKSFVDAGIDEIVCIVNEYSLDVKRFVESKHFPLPITFVVKTTPSSMHSLFALAPFLGETPFLLSTVDAVFHDHELATFVRYAVEKAQSVDGILAVTSFVDDESPLYVQMDAERRIIGFSKEDPTPWVTGGLYVFNPRIFHEIDRVLDRRIERLRNFLGHILNAGYTLEGFPFSKIIDIDHARDIESAELFLRGGV
jgi:NDP-sugar pyrophosphorylase family protein